MPEHMPHLDLFEMDAKPVPKAITFPPIREVGTVERERPRAGRRTRARKRSRKKKVEVQKEAGSVSVKKRKKGSAVVARGPVGSRKFGKGEPGSLVEEIYSLVLGR